MDQSSCQAKSLRLSFQNIPRSAQHLLTYDFVWDILLTCLKLGSPWLFTASHNISQGSSDFLEDSYTQHLLSSSGTSRPCLPSLEFFLGSPDLAQHPLSSLWDLLTLRGIPWVLSGISWPCAASLEFSLGSPDLAQHPLSSLSDLLTLRGIP